MALVVADFNRDGIPDVAVVESAVDRVSISLGGLVGQWSYNLPLRVGHRPVALAAADLNRDACTDLVVANYLSNDLSVLLGQCDGTFFPSVQSPIAVGEKPKALGIGDFDGDHCPDLAVANKGSNEVTIFIQGKGSGCKGLFHIRQQLTATQPALGRSPAALALGRFNPDRALDLAVVNSDSNDLTILAGRGDGTFTTLARIPTPQDNGPAALVTGDFDRDGWEDLVVANRFSGYLRVLLGEGNGGFRLEGRIFTGTGPIALVSGDFNRDGALDLVTVNWGSGDLYAFLGRGDGSFAFIQDINVGPHPSAAATADLNHDSCLDLVVVSEASPKPFALFGQCNGGFAKTLPTRPSTSAGGPYEGRSGEEIEFKGTASTDANAKIVSYRWSLGDGMFKEGESIAYSYARPGVYDVCLTVVDNRGLSAFDCTRARIVGESPAEASALPNPLLPSKAGPSGHSKGVQGYKVGQDPSAVASGDFDGDGLLDLAVVNRKSNDLSVLLGRGDGTFTKQQRFPVSEAPDQLTVADLDQDGVLDLIITSSTSGHAVWLKGRGDGTFELAKPSLDLGYVTTALLIEDLNGDEFPDLVTVDGEQNMVAVRFGEGDGHFVSASVLSVGRSPRSIVRGDFNGDGRWDLAVVNFLSGTVSLLLGQGDGTFIKLKEAWAAEFPYHLVAGDFDGDGATDLAVFDSVNQRLGLLLGQGDGTFREGQVIELSGYSGPIATGDFDGDGIGDVVISGSLRSSVAVLFSASARIVEEIEVSSRPGSIAVGDFDQDGRDDCAVISRAAEEIFIRSACHKVLDH